MLDFSLNAKTQINAVYTIGCETGLTPEMETF